MQLRCMSSQTSPSAAFGCLQKFPPSRCSRFADSLLDSSCDVAHGMRCDCGIACLAGRTPVWRMMQTLPESCAIAPCSARRSFTCSPLLRIGQRLMRFSVHTARTPRRRPMALSPPSGTRMSEAMSMPPPREFQCGVDTALHSAGGARLCARLVSVVGVLVVELSAGLRACPPVHPSLLTIFSRFPLPCAPSQRSCPRRRCACVPPFGSRDLVRRLKRRFRRASYLRSALDDFCIIAAPIVCFSSDTVDVSGVRVRHDGNWSWKGLRDEQRQARCKHGGISLEVFRPSRQW